MLRTILGLKVQFHVSVRDNIGTDPFLHVVPEIVGETVELKEIRID